MTDMTPAMGHNNPPDLIDETLALRALLEQAEAALKPFADAMEDAKSTTKTQTLGLLESAAFYHLRGGSFQRAFATLAALRQHREVSHG